jgi:hypothetical protein
MNVFGYSIAREIIVKVVGVVLVMVLFVALLGQCEKRREAAAQARIDREQKDARIDSGRDAVETVGNAAAREQESADLGRRNEQEIRNAQGASDKVGRGVGDAGIDSLCRRAAYRDSERCRLR